MSAIQIRTTDRGMFKKCRRMWDYTSHLRQNYEPAKPQTPLAFGIGIHKGLEAYYNPESWTHPVDVKVANAVLKFQESFRKQYAGYPDLSPEEEIEKAELLTLGRDILLHYGRWAPGNDAFTPIKTEYEFNVPVFVPSEVSSLPPRFAMDEERRLIYRDWHPNDDTYTEYDVVYGVRIDLVLEDQDGDIWIKDHKTTARFDDLGFLDMDTQISSYAWAYAVKHNVPVAGFIYNELKKKAPEPPKLISKGKALSKDKSQGTTYDLYVEAIKNHGFAIEDYAEFLQFLQHQENQFFRRTPIHRNPTELANQGRYIFYEAMDMLNDPAIYPSPQKFNCNYCSFKSPCVVDNEGGDVQFVLNDSNLYRKANRD